MSTFLRIGHFFGLSHPNSFFLSLNMRLLLFLFTNIPLAYEITKDSYISKGFYKFCPTFQIMNYRLFGNEREFINGRCRTISGHFFANCINIFHKTEVQSVILMCLMGLNHDYDTKRKNKPQKRKKKQMHFSTISQNNGNGNICILSHNF